MRFKTYAGRSLAELVPQIREELGPDAVILKQRETRSGGVGGFFAQRGVEVLAADHVPGGVATAEDAPAGEARGATVDVSDAEAESTQDLLRTAFADALQARLDRGVVDEDDPHEAAAPRETTTAADAAAALPGRPPAPDASGPPAAPPAPAFEPLQVEPRPTPDAGLHLAARPVPPVGPAPRPPVVGARASRPAGASAAPVAWEPDEEAADLVLELERAGVSFEVASELVREVRLHVLPFGGGRLRERTRATIAGRIATRQGWASDGSARRIALVGGSGVGKTSTAAKLASAWAEAGLRVGLVVVDAAGEGDERHALALRLGADADRLLAYAAGAEVVRVSSPDEASRAQARLAARDVVVVDTPGLGAADDARSRAVAATLAAVAAHETHLVLPLGLAAREAEAAVGRFRRLGADRLLVTKTDEARFAGPLLELAVRTGVPLSYLGEGPLVPGDLRAADGGSIAARILPI